MGSVVLLLYQLRVCFGSAWRWENTATACDYHTTCLCCSFQLYFKTPLLLRLLNLVCIQSLAYFKLSLTCWFPAPSVLLTAWLPGWRPAGCGCFSSARWESHQPVYIFLSLLGPHRDWTACRITLVPVSVIRPLCGKEYLRVLVL